MINLDFPIEKVSFEFKTVGTGKINLIFNNKNFQNIKKIQFNEKEILKKNQIQIFFSKDDPSDTNSFAILKELKINNGNFTEIFKKLPYYINTAKHKDSVDSIINNCYYGYIGYLNFEINTNVDLLDEAAWLIAKNSFQNPKENTRGNPYREKNFSNIYNDYKFLYTGCVPPKNKEILDFVNNIKIQDIRLPLDFKTVKTKIENWINKSKRIKIQNFDKLQYFNYGSGTLHFLQSFISRAKDKIFLPQKHFYFLNEMAKGWNCKIHNLFDTIEPNSFVLFEFPNPWYDNELMLKKIHEAREKKCYIGLDLTWLPVTQIDIDFIAEIADEIFFNMNKTWPINNIRPAWRWSKEVINDTSNHENNWGYYQTLQPNLFLQLLEKFDIDYIYNYYKNNSQKIVNTFDLKETNILWFTTHKKIKHQEKNYINENYFYDEFVCINKLLEEKGKFFW